MYVYVYDVQGGTEKNYTYFPLMIIDEMFDCDFSDPNYSHLNYAIEDAIPIMIKLTTRSNPIPITTTKQFYVPSEITLHSVGLGFVLASFVSNVSG